MLNEADIDFDTVTTGNPIHIYKFYLLLLNISFSYKSFAFYFVAGIHC